MSHHQIKKSIFTAMENFIVSARKYRPASFDTVVGQPSITNTLKNAIRNQHLAQAFLFTGSRGVGKTTTARLLAKTINCTNVSKDIEACNECESCTTFNNGQSLNIYELDAASNNSVDDIRALVEQVRYAPVGGKYKVYIIDEVHMLSPNAFNAFLKTLEEPPSYAVFILATTEKHKIIPTILSRCQIFDFNRITVDDITKHLKEIAVKENVQAEEDGLHIIAQKADGAMRDALSMFDQLVNFTNGNLTYKAVISNLNILDYDYYFKVTDQILKGDVSSSLLTFNEILSHGFDGHHFVNGLASHFRDLLVCLDQQTITLLEVSQTIKEKYKSQSVAAPLPMLIEGLNILSACDIRYKESKNQRLHVELTLMKLCALSFSDKKKVVETPSLPYAAPAATPAIAAEPVIAKKETPVTNQQTPAIPPTVSSQTATTKTVFSKHSIKGALKNEEVKPVITDNTKLPEENFSQEQLISEWKKFAERFVKNRQSLYSALTGRLPQMGNDFNIQLMVDNVVSEKDVNEIKSDLLGELRQNLRNFKIQLNITVSSLDSSERKPYTPREKVAALSKVNPVIEDLTRTLGLDLD